MANNQGPAERVRMVPRQHPEIIVRKMFSGVSYVLRSYRCRPGTPALGVLGNRICSDLTREEINPGWN